VSERAEPAYTVEPPKMRGGEPRHPRRECAALATVSQAVVTYRVTYDVSCRHKREETGLLGHKLMKLVPLFLAVAEARKMT
jgi:hypothetical protein